MLTNQEKSMDKIVTFVSPEALYMPVLKSTADLPTLGIMARSVLN